MAIRDTNMPEVNDDCTVCSPECKGCEVQVAREGAAVEEAVVLRAWATLA